MTDIFLDEIAAAFGQPSPAKLNITGRGNLPSAFRVTDLAVATMGFAGLQLCKYAGIETGAPSDVTVDRRLASFWFGISIQPEGWKIPPAWDSIAGDYQGEDGWIKLHTNAPAHRRAALSVIGEVQEKPEVAKAVAKCQVEALESAIVAAGGCAAAMRRVEDWAIQGQGKSVATEPLAALTEFNAAGRLSDPIDPARPLRGVRVLDLTRVLAGPVAGRFLAGYGADLLRIDPPWWEEPGVVPEVTLGKRCAGLDLRADDDRRQFEQLLGKADVFLHGYRPDALARLGYDTDALRRINPTMVDVALDAYGWTGPWAGRRGFDSLVQMSSGIADHGMRQAGADRPVPLPVQALDHATGYLMASAVLYGLHHRRTQAKAVQARLSLARTAALLLQAPADTDQEELEPKSAQDVDPTLEQTEWGPARRIRFPLTIPGIDAGWPYPAGRLRSSPAEWW